VDFVLAEEEEAESSDGSSDMVLSALFSKKTRLSDKRGDRRVTGTSAPGLWTGYLDRVLTFICYVISNYGGLFKEGTFGLRDDLRGTFLP